MAEDANMTQASNLLDGQEISVEHLIEKAVETAVNKAFVKELVDKVAEKAARKAFSKATKKTKRVLDDAFVEFTQRFNDLQSSTQNLDAIVQNAADEALAKFSERLNELQSSPLTEPIQQGAVDGERAAAAAQTVINELEEPAQETMEIEEAMDVSLQDVEEDEDEDNSEDSSENEYDAPWAYPSPGSIYTIHMDSRSILAANECSGLVTRNFLNARYRKMISEYCHWLCIGGLNDSLHFRNVATGKYLGADPVRSHRGLPVLTATSTDLGVNTRFHLQGLYRDSLRVQIRVGHDLYYVAAKDYTRSKNNNGLNLICTKRADSHTIFSFRKLSEAPTEE